MRRCCRRFVELEHFDKVNEVEMWQVERRKPPEDRLVDVLRSDADVSCQPGDYSKNACRLCLVILPLAAMSISLKQVIRS